MIRAVLRLFGLVDAEADPARYEPVFGLPKQSLDEWLSRHPSMRERYAAELARVSNRRRRNFKIDRRETSRPRAPPDAGSSLRTLADRRGVDEETWLFHLHRGDYSRWFRAAVKDNYLAEQAERIERRSDLRPAETRGLIRSLIETRYTLPA